VGADFGHLGQHVHSVYVVPAGVLPDLGSGGVDCEAGHARASVGVNGGRCGTAETCTALSCLRVARAWLLGRVDMDGICI